MTKDKLKDAAAGAGIQAVVGLLAFGALWFIAVRDDLNDLQVARVQQADDIAALEARHEADDELAVRMARLEDAVDQIGEHLKIPGFPKLGRK